MRRHVILGIVGAVLSLVSAYLAAAFVHADWFWMSDIWEWDKPARAFFLMMVAMVSIAGASVGQLALINSGDD